MKLVANHLLIIDWNTLLKRVRDIQNLIVTLGSKNWTSFSRFASLKKIRYYSLVRVGAMVSTVDKYYKGAGYVGYPGKKIEKSIFN